jgi:hypothetical protein
MKAIPTHQLGHGLQTTKASRRNPSCLVGGTTTTSLRPMWLEILLYALKTNVFWWFNQSSFGFQFNELLRVQIQLHIYIYKIANDRKEKREREREREHKKGKKKPLICSAQKVPWNKYTAISETKFMCDSLFLENNSAKLNPNQATCLWSFPRTPRRY